jgi:hypothetical protein
VTTEPYGGLTLTLTLTPITSFIINDLEKKVDFG